MNPNLVIMVVTVWIILSIFFGIGEGVYLGQSYFGTGDNPADQAAFSQLMHPDDMFQWFKALLDVVTFNFDMFHGGWVVFQWIIFAPLTTGLVVGIMGMGGAASAVILSILGISALLNWIL